MTNTSTTAAAILASDFSKSLDDVNRRAWTLGKLRYIVAALDGAPVAIVLNSSGFAEIGVKLVAAFDGGPSRGPRLTIERANGTRTNYWAREIGETIIPLANTGAKWAALKAWSEDGSAATRLARAAHGETEGRAWGEWSADVDTAHPGGQIRVSYKPHTTNPAFADRWGTRWYGRVNLATEAISPRG